MKYERSGTMPHLGSHRILKCSVKSLPEKNCCRSSLSMYAILLAQSLIDMRFRGQWRKAMTQVSLESTTKTAFLMALCIFLTVLTMLAYFV